MQIRASKKVLKCAFICSVVQYALCMHCARSLYKLHVTNGEIEVGPDSRQVPNVVRLKCSMYIVVQWWCFNV